MITAPPILLLAFANDRADSLGYLRNLPAEARQLRVVLEQAAQAGLCELLVRQNVTISELLDIFQDPRYRNRIALFHYGGHANGYQLLLETAAGQTALADAGGLAAFLGHQTNLALVFLNGCSTQQQTQGLLDAGVATVIATSQAIDDAVATDFAIRFYQGLAGGATLQMAFSEAIAASKVVYGNDTRHLYYTGTASPLSPITDCWPWTLNQRPGAETVLQWNLPQAANTPLFGLPGLPKLDLPESPYRHLDWFRREHAAVFFGRGHAIRELYQRVTGSEGAPIILFYGQSGVGKSSLLAAGLAPRLEQSHCIHYVRRDQTKGLLGTLNALFNQNPAPDNGPALAQAWLATEAQTNRPLVIILDQVEEIYTRPNQGLADEMATFIAALQASFSDLTQRPQGRLILSFRKEWLAEIEKQLAAAKLARTKVFLGRLDRHGIIEAVCGPAITAQLQCHFGLTLEPELPAQIADDLLEDQGAAVAPTLQILLTKLWDRAKTRNYDHPRIDRQLYGELRQEGLLLKDFLDQQLVTLGKEQPAVVESGLALDLLAFHTTPLGTAEQRTFAELQACYRHQSAILAALVRKCQELYLLVDPAQNHPDAEPASRLAHDTLAPLVRVRFDESILPGQRARRILESRVMDWGDDKEGVPLDDTDLRWVEVGQMGMRLWARDEQRLVEASQMERQRQKEEHHRVKQEQEIARQRELILERQTRQRSQALVGIMAVVSSILLALFLRSYFWSWITRGPLVFIQAGSAVIGTNNPNAKAEERPQIYVKLNAYRIEQYEVTNAQYRRCVSVNQCTSLKNPKQLEDKHYDKHPVVDITAIQAASYCHWIGRRLPTELEWEYAAHRDPNKAWPWGDDVPTKERTNMPLTDEKQVKSTVPVTDLSDGASRSDGIYQLIGNAWEWTSSPVQLYRSYNTSLFWDGKADSLKENEFLVMRGGGYDNAIERVTERSMLPADQSSDSTGFRCAIDD